MATVSIIFNVAQGWHELMSPFFRSFFSCNLVLFAEMINFINRSCSSFYGIIGVGLRPGLFVLQNRL